MTSQGPAVRTQELIMEILDSMKYLIEAHKGYAELGEVRGNSIVIFCGGMCLDCENKCIEEAIKARVPDIDITFR